MKYFSFHICSSLIFIIVFSTFALALDSSNCTVVNFAEYGEIAEKPQMRFYLFTKNNPNNEEELKTNDNISLSNPYYDSQRQTRIIVHGYKANLTNCVNAYLKDAYLQKGDFNVIVVDWNDWAQASNYIDISSDYYVNYLGQLLADFIQILNNSGTPSNNIYLIGHSMGAHLCGSAGRKLSNKVNTIYGIDPAKPNFEGFPQKILHCTDADYVEAIITSMLTFAHATRIGCSTFYPNYGYNQPYCQQYESQNIACDHVAGVRYVSESINSNEFCAAQCSYWGVLAHWCRRSMSPNNKMGGEPSVRKSGVYYLTTNDQSPFALGC